MRLPGDAILNPFGALPQTTPNAQSASTLDAPMHKERERLELIRFPIHQLSHFGSNLRSEVCSGSCHPSHAMVWPSEVDLAKSMEDL